MHFYKFHINDYAVQTRHLSNNEDLCYRRLLDLYYTEESQIPLDTHWVARRIQISHDDVEVVLKDFFTKTENGWKNGRADAEIAEYHAVCEKNKSNGKRGGRPKKAKRNPEKPTGNPEETQTKASRTLSLISNQESDTPIVPVNGDVQTDLIDKNLHLNRARMLFRMRPSTQLDSAQLRSWKKNKGVVETTSEEDWLLLEWLFAQGTGKGEAGEYRRKDLGTLLANWNGEIQRARTEASNRGADFLKKEKRGGDPEPEGWRRILVELYDDSDPEAVESATWEGLPPAVRAQIKERMREVTV
jgi:uncharacterized protein YdaU (DUF1376 family)